MRGTRGPFLLALFILLLASPSASAVDPPKAPPTLIIDLLSYTANTPSATWDTVINVTWETPEGFNTTLGWTWFLNLTPDTGICPDSGCYDDIALPIPYLYPERPGWATAQFSFFGVEAVNPIRESVLWSFRNATIYAVNSTEPGTPSCQVPIKFSQLDNGMYLGPLGGVPGSTDGTFTTLTHKVPNEAGAPSYHACGTNATLEPIPGIAALVNSTYQAGNGTSEVNVSWAPVRTDPNFTLDYYVLRRYTDPPDPRSTLYWTLDSPTDGLDTPNYHAKVFVGSGANGTIDPAWFTVLARDNLTHQRSAESCTVQVTQGQKGSVATCGGIALPFDSADLGAPQLPGLDIPAAASAFGVTVEVMGWIVGVIFAAGCFAGGWIAAGRPGALILGLGGVGADYALNLLPGWFLVVTYMVMLAAIIHNATRGDAASA